MTPRTLQTLFACISGCLWTPAWPDAISSSTEGTDLLQAILSWVKCGPDYVFIGTCLSFLDSLHPQAHRDQFSSFGTLHPSVQIQYEFVTGLLMSLFNSFKFQHIPRFMTLASCLFLHRADFLLYTGKSLVRLMCTSAGLICLISSFYSALQLNIQV